MIPHLQGVSQKLNFFIKLVVDYVNGTGALCKLINRLDVNFFILFTLNISPP
jgi:hypothetical protein